MAELRAGEADSSPFPHSTLKRGLISLTIGFLFGFLLALLLSLIRGEGSLAETAQEEIEHSERAPSALPRNQE